MYVSLYLRVAYLVPLTFCFQSDQVKAKRQRYKCTLLTIDLIAYTVIMSVLTIEIAFKVADTIS